MFAHGADSLIFTRRCSQELALDKFIQNLSIQGMGYLSSILWQLPDVHKESPSPK